MAADGQPLRTARSLPERTHRLTSCGATVQAEIIKLRIAHLPQPRALAGQIGTVENGPDTAHNQAGQPMRVAAA